ncbi:MAG: trigger factor [Deltaproteobacteria bacterium]|jgi:trigger factor|nr:trigger factor [Deltaproteobacteria bacterium]
MQYKVEDLAPLKKKFEVTVPAADIDKHIDLMAAKYRASVSVPGFRKGKAPLKMIEAQYHKDIYSEATSEMIDGNVRRIIDELELDPASKVEYDAEVVARGKDFTYSFSFEVMPVFDLPDYQGFPVEEEEVVVGDDEIDNMLQMARRDLADMAPVSEKRAPRDGDVATVDMTAFDEEGKEIPSLTVSGLDLALGEKLTFEAFEDFVKSVTVGEEAEKQITFPADFMNSEFAGKEVRMKVKVSALNERQLPELNDEFAAKLGPFATMDAVRDAIRTSFTQSRANVTRSVAQNKLLEGLLGKIDFPLPETLVQRFTAVAQANHFDRLRQQAGKGDKPQDIGKLEDFRDQAVEEAKKHVKEYVFLYRVAKAEKIEVSEQEILQFIAQSAASARRSFEEVRDEYVNNNMIGVVHERIMSDKALKHLYSKAEVTMVKPAAKPEEK